jgi:hypothetical protein
MLRTASRSCERGFRSCERHFPVGFRIFPPQRLFFRSVANDAKRARNIAAKRDAGCSSMLRKIMRTESLRPGIGLALATIMLRSAFPIGRMIFRIII